MHSRSQHSKTLKRVVKWHFLREMPFFLCRDFAKDIVMVYNRVKNKFFTNELVRFASIGTKALPEPPKHRRFCAKWRLERGKAIAI